MGESIIGNNNLGSMLTALGRRVGELEQYRTRMAKSGVELVLDDDAGEIIIRVVDKKSKLYGAYVGWRFADEGILEISGKPLVE